MGAKNFLHTKSGSIERQLTDSDCAVWVIKAICFQVGVSVPPANLIRKHIEIKDGGTSIRDVRDALQEFGVSAQPVEGPADAVAQAPLPAIALVRLEDQAFHYVVVLEANAKTVKFFDPSVGGVAQTTSAETFASQFTGSLVLCEKQADYVVVDFEQDVEPNKFLLSALRGETNAGIALAIGEIFQLLMLLGGILMLKNFFGSSMLGMPNFWFLAGIAICAIIYMWIGKLQQLVRADIKARSLLTLCGFATRLIRKHEFSPKSGVREKSMRCMQTTTSVAHSIATVVSLPGSTLSLLLFIALVTWVDPYAGCYTAVLSIGLPLICLWMVRKTQNAKRDLARLRERNEIGLVYLMAKPEPNHSIIDDMPWSQLAYCDAASKYDESVAINGMIATAVGRASVFAGLLIGGLQHQALGMGHTVAVFFLLSIFSSVVGQWSRQLSSLPECRYHVRSLLDFLSDFTASPLSFSRIQKSGQDVSSESSDSALGLSRIELGGTS